MIDDEEIDDGEESEGDGYEMAFPSTLNLGEAFFFPDLGTFCHAHEAKAVVIAEDGSIWIYPRAGGDAVRLDKWKPKAPQVKALRTVQ